MIISIDMEKQITTSSHDKNPQQIRLQKEHTST